ncbi:hypothetical protein [Nonomuraea sp. B1E8]|uniref:hypothetical protein n=1 Tax=unclassified Nonomuraea TaxID=2593643 RepID=UPI00325CD1B6
MGIFPASPTAGRSQDNVLEGGAETIWDAPGVTPQGRNTAKLSILNATLVSQREAMERAETTRTESAVEIVDAVVQSRPDGSVRVMADVKRTWIEQSESGSEAAQAKDKASTSGLVEGSEQTLSIFVFDRCGGLTIIEAPLPRYQDSTDGHDPCSGFVNPDGSEHQVCEASGGDGGGSAGPRGLEGWGALRVCANSGCRSDLFGWNYLTKGLAFEAGGVLRWVYPAMMRDAVFNVKEWSGYVSVKKTGSFGKSKIDKYVLNNLRLKLETSLTFSSVLASPSISWPPGVGVSGGSDTGTLSFDASVGVKRLLVEPTKFSTTCGNLFCEGFDRIKHTVTGTLIIPISCKPNPSKPKDCEEQAKPLRILPKHWWAPTTWPFNYDDGHRG